MFGIMCEFELSGEKTRGLKKVSLTGCSLKLSHGLHSRAVCFTLYLFECRLATWHLCRTMLLRGLSPGISGVRWIVSSPERRRQHGGSTTTPKAGSRSWPSTVSMCHQATGTPSVSMSIFEIKLKDLCFWVVAFNRPNILFILYLQAPSFISVLPLASE